MGEWEEKEARSGEQGAVNSEHLPLNYLRHLRIDFCPCGTPPWKAALPRGERTTPPWRNGRTAWKTESRWTPAPGLDTSGAGFAGVTTLAEISSNL